MQINAKEFIKDNVLQVKCQYVSVFRYVIIHKFHKYDINKTHLVKLTNLDILANAQFQKTGSYNLFIDQVLPRIQFLKNQLH